MKALKKSGQNPLFFPPRWNPILLSAVFIFLMFPVSVFSQKLPDMGFLAWVHLVPILVAFWKESPLSRFWSYFLAFTLGYMGALYWVVIALSNYGGITVWQAVLVLALFSMLLALLISVFLVIVTSLKRYSRIPLFILLPFVLFAHDWLLDFFPEGGFPWLNVSYTQGQWLSFFQWIDVTGAAGLNFFIYLVNGLIAEGLVCFVYKKEVDKMVSRFLVVFVLTLFSLYMSFLSGQSFEKHKKVIGEQSLGLIQANIPQSMKWERHKAYENLNKHLKLSMFAVKNGADVVLWPESAYPFAIEENRFDSERFLDLEELGADYILGSNVRRKVKGRTKNSYNAIVHYGKDAKAKSYYYKIHLVPFGEYIPWQSVFPFLRSFNQVVANFSPGEEYRLFDVNGLKMGSLICFEDVFFDVSREFAKRGAHVIVNYTNDAWYDDSSAVYQHLAFSQFRALENRRPVVRVTNSGYTAVISPTGKVLKSLPILKERYLVYDLKIENKESFFTKHGSQSWSLGIVGFAGLILIYSLIKRLLGPVKRID